MDTGTRAHVCADDGQPSLVLGCGFKMRPRVEHRVVQIEVHLPCRINLRPHPKGEGVNFTKGLALTPAFAGVRHAVVDQYAPYSEATRGRERNLILGGMGFYL